MERMNDLPGVMQGCVPRRDIIDGAYELEAFAADLNLVIEGKKGYLYSDPENFFKNTYPTDGLKTTIREVFGRLTGTHPGAPVIKLETGLGGGKTHTLIALYHLAKHGTNFNEIEGLIGDLKFEPMMTAAIVGTEVGISTQEGKRRTLWGELAYQLKGYDGYDIIKTADQQMVS
ncbi:MAG: AAA family ATPase, partial [Thermoplasmata archaeon]